MSCRACDRRRRRCAQSHRTSGSREAMGQYGVRSSESLRGSRVEGDPTSTWRRTMECSDRMRKAHRACAPRTASTLSKNMNVDNVIQHDIRCHITTLAVFRCGCGVDGTLDQGTTHGTVNGCPTHSVE